MKDGKELPLKEESPADKTGKKTWQPMKVTVAGDAKDIIRHGHGKTSPSPADPGEALKNPQVG